MVDVVDTYASATTRLQKENLRDLRSAEENLPNYEISLKPEQEERLVAIGQSLRVSDYPVQFFLSKLLRPPETIDDNQRRSTMETFHTLLLDRNVHDILKTAPENGVSKLQILYDVLNPENAINGVVVNTIGRSQAKIWRDLYLGNNTDAPLPVAPILLDRNGKPRIYPTGIQDVSRIYSRYCGISLASLEKMINESKDKSLRSMDLFSSLTTVGRIDDMYEALVAESEGIKTAIRTQSLYHGHAQRPEYAGKELETQTHSGNFTVEFARKSYYEEELAAGRTINTMHFNRINWTFSPFDYIKNPNEWTPIVRLIDFDAIKKVEINQ